MALEACTGGWSLLSIHPVIPARFLLQALESRDAIQTAYDLGILDLVSISLTILGLLIGLSALVGFRIFRREAIHAARAAAAETIPAEVLDYMRKNSDALLRDNPEIVTAIQAALLNFGLRDTVSAQNIVTEAINPEGDGT